MKTILLSLCSIGIISLFFLLFSHLLKKTRTKSSLYKHKSELPREPHSWVAKQDNSSLYKADIKWEDEEGKR